MKELPIVDETGQTIGTIKLYTYPYGHVEETRQSAISSDDPYENIPETITIRDTIIWQNARNYPDEVARIESNYENYHEVGKRVHGTWIAAAILVESGLDGTDYLIRWLGAYSHRLPVCTVRYSK